MFFQKTYKPIPLAYNLVVAMLWRHPENVELEKVKAVHYCAAVSTLWSLKFINFILAEFFFFFKFSLLINISIFLVNRGQSHGGTRARKLTWTERTSRCWWQNGGIYTMMNPLISMLIIKTEVEWWDRLTITYKNRANLVTCSDVLYKGLRFKSSRRAET